MHCPSSVHGAILVGRVTVALRAAPVVLRAAPVALRAAPPDPLRCPPADDCYLICRASSAYCLTSDVTRSRTSTVRHQTSHDLDSPRPCSRRRRLKRAKMSILRPGHPCAGEVARSGCCSAAMSHRALIVCTAGGHTVATRQQHEDSVRSVCDSSTLSRHLPPPPDARLRSTTTPSTAVTTRYTTWRSAKSIHLFNGRLSITFTSYCTDRTMPKSVQEHLALRSVQRRARESRLDHRPCPDNTFRVTRQHLSLRAFTVPCHR